MKVDKKSYRTSSITNWSHNHKNKT